MLSENMLDLSRLRDHAQHLITDATDGAAMEKAAQFAKLVEEMENDRAGTRKLAVERRDVILRQRSERRLKWKEILEKITPLITTAILTGTLIFQAYTFRKSEQDKIEDAKRQSDLAEKARWTEALKLLQLSEKVSPASALLRSFTTPPYNNYARNEALTLLATKDDDPGQFKDLFRVTFEPVHADSLQDLIDLNRRLKAEENPLLLKDWDKVKLINNTRKLTVKEKKLIDSLSRDLEVVNAGLVTLLKSPRASGATTDFSGLDVAGIDFSSVDLSGLDLRYSIVSSVRFDGVSLKDGSNCEGATFTGTPWWHAATINAGCLQYLTKEFPFRPGENYAETSPVPTKDDYQISVKRLRGD